MRNCAGCASAIFDRLLRDLRSVVYRKKPAQPTISSTPAAKLSSEQTTASPSRLPPANACGARSIL